MNAVGLVLGVIGAILSGVAVRFSRSAQHHVGIEIDGRVIAERQVESATEAELLGRRLSAHIGDA